MAHWKHAQRPHPATTSSSESEQASIMITTPPQLAPTTGCDTYFFPQPALSVYGALFDNGRILGLICGNSTAQKPNPASPTIPESLHPTPTRLSTIHFQWDQSLPISAHAW